jgi:Predicted hydrolases or acyltransferases (alpha/beta hydrolase superfamily)
MTAIHTELVGNRRPRLAILPGLFGRGRNWSGVANELAAQGYPTVLFDLPNHGRSGWTETFSYPDLADLVAEEIRLRLGSAASIVLVGHSLGGKVAMLTALRHPELVTGLGVVDIAPAVSEQVTSFGPLIEAMRSLDLSALESRAQADALLAAKVPDAASRGLLLQNLRRRPQWHWQLNLELLGASMEQIADWPDPGPLTYPGPTLWLTGARSPYCRPEHLPIMRRLFPAVEQVVVPGAGHWVHADNPDAVIDALIGLARLSEP